MPTPSSVLAWEIPWTRSLEGYRPQGRIESDTTERQSTEAEQRHVLLIVNRVAVDVVVMLICRH